MKEKVKTGSIGIGTLLFLLFIIMKLFGIEPVSEWSWFWVISPLWIPTAIFIGLFVGIAVIGFLGMGLFGIVEYIRDKINN